MPQSLGHQKRHITLRLKIGIREVEDQVSGMQRSGLRSASPEEY
jgi:hypothetical protein